MKKIFSLLLICALLISALVPAALAETTLNTLTLERALVRAAGDGYEYFTYSPATFDTEGIMGAMDIDLDSDGATEQLRVFLSEDNLVTLDVYESVDGVWTLSDSSMLYFASFNCNVQANDVFLKPVNNQWYIFSENWTHENCMADGAAWSLRAYTYNGETLACDADFYVDGTDVSGNLQDWTTEPYLLEERPELKEIAEKVLGYGFNITALYWDAMIVEQDTSVYSLCRVLSVQDIPYETVSNFTSAGGSSLSGFRTIIIDCSANGFRLPEAYYLSNNTAVYYEELGELTEPAIEQTEDLSEYIIADSDTRALTEEELKNYDKDTLALIRNEILARYGYPFQKEKYRDYFGSKSWYTRNENFNYSMLSSLEMENIELIKKLEAK